MDFLLFESNKLTEILPYFSCELFFVLAMLLNLILFLFYKRKNNTGKISNTICAGTFLLNTLILTGIYIKNLITFGSLSFTVIKDTVCINNINIAINIFINLFLFVYVITTYKFIKKIHIKVPIVNCCLVIIALLSTLSVYLDNFILAYIFLDLISIFIYKYGSSMQIRNYKLFSKDYILLGLISSVLFFSFYFVSLSMSDSQIQTDIIQVCMTLAVFLKIGLFPVYNYQITKEYKDNIPYSILLFTYLPMMGVISFGKMAEYMSVSDEIYQIPILAFSYFSIISFILFASKQKNLIKFLANFSYFVNMLCIVYTIYFSGENYKALELALGFAFCMIAFYCMISVLKLNLFIEKINLNIFKGIAITNRKFAFICTFCLLELGFVLPSLNSLNMFEMLKNIYSSDKTGIYTIIVILFSVFAIVFKIFNTIKNIYTLNPDNTKEEFKTGVKHLYTTPVLILIILIIALIVKYLFL